MEGNMHYIYSRAASHITLARKWKIHTENMCAFSILFARIDGVIREAAQGFHLFSITSQPIRESSEMTLWKKGDFYCIHRVIVKFVSNDWFFSLLKS